MLGMSAMVSLFCWFVLCFCLFTFFAFCHVFMICLACLFCFCVVCIYYLSFLFFISDGAQGQCDRAIRTDKLKEHEERMSERICGRGKAERRDEKRHGVIVKWPKRSISDLNS